MPVDMSELKVGNRIRFRNGGVSKVRNLEASNSIYYPIGVRINNFHASCEKPWSYDEKGMCGEGTGPGNRCPLDIVEILKR